MKRAELLAACLMILEQGEMPELLKRLAEACSNKAGEFYQDHAILFERAGQLSEIIVQTDSRKKAQ